MKSQLIKSSIEGLLYQENSSSETIQDAEGSVRSTWLDEDLKLIGFVPYNALDFTFRVCVNIPFVFTPKFMSFKGGETVLPICSTVKSAYGKEYLLNNTLEIYDTLCDFIPNYYLNSHPELKASISGDELSSLLKKGVIKDEKKDAFGNGHFIKDENDNTFYYLVDEFEYELSLGGMTYICRNFLCLCSYINKVTGKPEYVLLPSDSVIRILPTENEG